jgi:transposase-like protein
MGMSVNELMDRAQKLKTCDVCKLETEPQGGIGMRQKWYCAKCWVKFMQQRGMK